MGETPGGYDKPRMTAAIAAYFQLWDEWQEIKATNPACSTL